VGSPATLPAGGPYAIRVARTPDEVEALRDARSRLAADQIGADVDHFLRAVRVEPRIERPHVIVLERDDAEAMVFGRIEDVPLPCNLGYRTLYAPVVRSLTVGYRATAGRVDGETAPCVVDAILAALRDGEADVALLSALDTESPLYRSLLARTPGYLRTVDQARPHRDVAIPGSLDELLASLSKSTRESTKRYAKKLEKALGDDLAVELFRDPADVERLAADVERVAAKTWQRQFGVGFRDDERWRSRLAWTAERGWLRAVVLYAAGEPVAFWHGFAYGGRFRTETPGYDPAFHELRPGTYLLLRLIEHLCADPDVSVLDFGFGDEEYKRRLADRTWQESTVTVHARRPRPILVNLVRKSLISVSGAATAVARRAGFYQKLRQRGRHGAGGGQPV